MTKKAFKSFYKTSIYNVVVADDSLLKIETSIIFSVKTKRLLFSFSSLKNDTDRWENALSHVASRVRAQDK